MCNRVSVSGTETKVQTLYRYRIGAKTFFRNQNFLFIIIVIFFCMVLERNATYYWLTDFPYEMWFWYWLWFRSKASANLGLGFGIGPKPK